MEKSRPEGVRWVVNGVKPETIRDVRSMAARHDVFFGEVVDQAVLRLTQALYDDGELPDGWKEY